MLGWSGEVLLAERVGQLDPQSPAAQSVGVLTEARCWSRASYLERSAGLIAMDIQLLTVAVVGGFVTLVVVVTAMKYCHRKTSRKPRLGSPICPTCGGDKFEYGSSGHADFADDSYGTFWYGTCETCKGRCAQWQIGSNTRCYVPSLKEWEQWEPSVDAPDECGNNKREEERLMAKAEHDRRYHWPFDKEWPFDTGPGSSADTK